MDINEVKRIVTRESDVLSKRQLVVILIRTDEVKYSLIRFELIRFIDGLLTVINI